MRLLDPELTAGIEGGAADAKRGSRGGEVDPVGVVLAEGSGGGEVVEGEAELLLCRVFLLTAGEAVEETEPRRRSPELL